MNQRKEVETLLISEYWRRDAVSIVQFALDAGYTIDEIAATLVMYGTELLILNSWMRKTFPVVRGPNA